MAGTHHHHHRCYLPQTAAAAAGHTQHGTPRPRVEPAHTDVSSRLLVGVLAIHRSVVGVVVVAVAKDSTR